MQTQTLDVGVMAYNSIWSGNIYFTKLKKIYERSYIKVQDVVATVGGFLA